MLGTDAYLPKATSRNFFEDWDDFNTFDAELKRRMPITSGEFDFLVQKEAEPERGWDICVDRKEIRRAERIFWTVNRYAALALRCAMTHPLTTPFMTPQNAQDRIAIAERSVFCARYSGHFGGS